MPDVFLSYQRGECEAVQIIAQKLAELRLDVWFDSQLHPGGTFDQEIANQLTASRAVLTCWTPAAIASEWVRAEATFAHEQAKLVACFLEPTQLIPPFNLMHAEDLTTWAGQETDPAWLKLLERIGDLVARPGISTYQTLFAPETTLATLRAWANAHGDDPLAAAIWDRIALLEGEASAQRVARESAEAKERDQRRKIEQAKSKALAKARGLRSGRTLPPRFVAATATVLLIALLGVSYLIDTQRRERNLNDATTPEAVRAFLNSNSWHPIATSARQKLAQMDDAAWQQLAVHPSLTALSRYLQTFPNGIHLEAAQKARTAAMQVRDVQLLLKRLGRYSSEASGAFDTSTADAIKTFQFERGAVVSGTIDAPLLAQLNVDIQKLSQVRPDELVAKKIGPPTPDEYRDVAGRLSVDAPTLEALRVVESLGRGFDAANHPTIVFERQMFSRLTNHRFDESHPLVSAPAAGGYAVPNKEWDRLTEAYALDPEAAYNATSFGMFQLVGSLHKSLGFETAAEYAHFVSQSEANQVEVFARYIEWRGALKSLHCLDWMGFARRWNGAGTFAQRYADRLRAAYAKAAEQFGTDASTVRPGCP